MDRAIVLVALMTITVPVFLVTVLAGVDIVIMAVLTVEFIIKPLPIVSVDVILT
jgi:hypothetical protein